MTALALGGPSPPDDPRRRLLWVLPLAVLLVLLGVLGAGYWLHEPKLPTPHRQAPVDARIYELPPSPASAPSRPHAPAAAPPHHAVAPARSAPPPRARPAVPARPSTPARPAAPPVPRAALPVPKPHVPVTPPKAAAAPSAPAPHVARRTLNWGSLSSQIDSVASSVVSHSAFAQVHDPHTLIARYYIAALLEKLQRIGDMVYTGQQSGAVDVRLIVGLDGTVRALELNGLNGASGLESVAHHIVTLSAPFSPFPMQLAKQTRRLKLTIHMVFMGAHNVNAQ